MGKAFDDYSSKKLKADSFKSIFSREYKSLVDVLHVVRDDISKQADLLAKVEDDDVSLRPPSPPPLPEMANTSKTSKSPGPTMAVVSSDLLNEIRTNNRKNLKNISNEAVRQDRTE
jgi:hypothetical protein